MNEELNETSQKLEAYELISHAVGYKNKGHNSVFMRKQSSQSMTNLIGDSTSVSKNSTRGKMTKQIGRHTEPKKKTLAKDQASNSSKTISNKGSKYNNNSPAKQQIHNFNDV